MVSIEEKVCKIVAEEEFNIYKVETLKTDILEVFDDFDVVEIDLSKVEEFDSAGLQFLVSLKKSTFDSNKKFVLSATSEKVNSYIELYDIGSYFE